MSGQQKIVKKLTQGRAVNEPVKKLTRAVMPNVIVKFLTISPSKQQAVKILTSYCGRKVCEKFNKLFQRIFLLLKF